MHWNLARDAWTRRRARGPTWHEAALHEPAGRRRERRSRVDVTDASAGCRWSSAGCTARSRRSRPRSSTLRPDARLVYVMTDGGALPIAISDLVWRAPRRAASSTRPSRAGTRSAATTKRSRCTAALAIARATSRRRRGRGRDGARAARAPGAASASAASRSEPCSTPRPGCTACPIAALRVSFADPRPRHQRRLASQPHDARRSRHAAASRWRCRASAATRKPQIRARPRRAPASTPATTSSTSSPVGIARPPRERGTRASSRWAGPPPTTRCCSKRPRPRSPRGRAVRRVRRLGTSAPVAIGRIRVTWPRLTDARRAVAGRTRPEPPRTAARHPPGAHPRRDRSRRRRLSAADHRLPPRVRARQGDAARHGRAAHDRADRRRLRARLPRPARTTTTCPTWASTPRRPRRCASR